MTRTIFALATPPGRGAIAIVRLSGPDCGRALTQLVRGAPPPPRMASLRRLRDPEGAVLDEAILLWQPGPTTYTGEDSVELHLHGGPAVVSAVFDALHTLGLAAAEPGEFTRRAFENGRIDLSQAEAIADLVAAENDRQRRQALDQLGGALSRRYASWQSRLLDVLALLEAAIDFPDEEIPPEVERRALTDLTMIAGELESASADGAAERVREGVRIALIGAPNVGKSSLLNVLAARDAAIVTPIPGTTRDVVEVRLTLAGQMAVLADTAGLRLTDDHIEAEGVRRAEAWAESADLRLGVVDATRPETMSAVEPVLQPGDLVVLNKIDLLDREIRIHDAGRVLASADPVGVTDLRVALETRVQQLTEVGEAPAVTQARHRRLLQEAFVALRSAIDDFPRGAELAAESVRRGLGTLEKVVGRGDPEAVLDRVFANFCIGK